MESLSSLDMEARLGSIVRLGFDLKTINKQHTLLQLNEMIYRSVMGGMKRRIALSRSLHS
jgi:hypothetical protein